ncbi:hypothetical protein ACLI4R_17515 [Natrialbaceae archaeon A-chndr2]
MEVETNIEHLDRPSKLILSKLYAEGGEAPAGELREAVGFEQTNQVHYRIEQSDPALGPNGLDLVRQDGYIEHDGNEHRLYALTERGLGVVRTYSAELPPAESMAQLDAAIGHFADRIRTVEDRLNTCDRRGGDAHERIDTLKDSIDEDLQSLEGKVDGYTGNLNDARDDADAALRAATGAKRRAEQTPDRDELRVLEERVESIERALIGTPQTETYRRNVETEVQEVLRDDEETLLDTVRTNSWHINVLWNVVDPRQLKENETVADIIERVESALNRSRMVRYPADED